MIGLFHCLDTYTDGIKAVVRKAAGALAQTKTEATKVCTNSLCILHLSSILIGNKQR